MHISHSIHNTIQLNYVANYNVILSHLPNQFSLHFALFLTLLNYLYMIRANDLMIMFSKYFPERVRVTLNWYKHTK